jgi:hypothetical protein
MSRMLAELSEGPPFFALAAALLDRRRRRELRRLGPDQCLVMLPEGRDEDPEVVVRDRALEAVRARQQRLEIRHNMRQVVVDAIEGGAQRAVRPSAVAVPLARQRKKASLFCALNVVQNAHRPPGSAGPPASL